MKNVDLKKMSNIVKAVRNFEAAHNTHDKDKNSFEYGKENGSIERITGEKLWTYGSQEEVMTWFDKVYDEVQRAGDFSRYVDRDKVHAAGLSWGTLDVVAEGAWVAFLEKYLIHLQGYATKAYAYPGIDGTEGYLFGARRGGKLGVCVKVFYHSDQKRLGGTVEFDHLGGTFETWKDLLACLYWDGQETDDSIGDFLAEWGEIAHQSRARPWRVDVRTGMSGCEDWRIHIQENDTAKYGLAGKITSSVHISCCGKVHGVSISSFEDWYVFLNTIPSPTIPEILESYKDRPIREIRSGMDLEWNRPGEEPWAKQASQASPSESKKEN